MASDFPTLHLEVEEDPDSWLDSLLKDLEDSETVINQPVSPDLGLAIPPIAFSFPRVEGKFASRGSVRVGAPPVRLALSARCSGLAEEAFAVVKSADPGLVRSEAILVGFGRADQARLLPEVENILKFRRIHKVLLDLILDNLDDRRITMEGFLSSVIGPLYTMRIPRAQVTLFLTYCVKNEEVQLQYGLTVFTHINYCDGEDTVGDVPVYVMPESVWGRVLVNEKKTILGGSRGRRSFAWP